MTMYEDYAWDNRRKSPEIYSHKYGQLLFDKGTKAIQWSQYGLFNKCRTARHPYEKKIHKPLNSQI